MNPFVGQYHGTPIKQKSPSIRKSSEGEKRYATSCSCAIRGKGHIFFIRCAIGREGRTVSKKGDADT